MKKGVYDSDTKWMRFIGKKIGLGVSVYTFIFLYKIWR